MGTGKTVPNIQKSMKVKLLKEIGAHPEGTIIDVDPVIVVQLERSGSATRNVKEKVVYRDSNGKEYTEEEVSAMDKRTALYKELMGIKTN